MMPSTTADEQQPTTTTFNAESYNSWRYGDEASLYSIAEDSREDRQSEALSRGGVSEHAMTLSTVSGGDNNGSSNRVACHVRGASGGSAGAFSLSGINPWRSDHPGNNDSDSDDDDIGDGRPVETKKWVPDEEMDFELNNMPPVLSSSSAGGSKRGRGGGAGPAAAGATRLPSILRRSGGSTTPNNNNASSTSKHNNNTTTTRTGIHRSPSFASSEDSYSQMLGYRLHHHGANDRSFRFMMVACLFCVAVAVTVLVVVLTTDINDQEGGGGIDSSSPKGRDGSGDLLVPAPSPTIATTLTSQPTTNYTDIIAQAAQEFAYESIAACPYANTKEFFDLTVPQAEVFRELIIELKAAAKVDATTNDSVVEFESSHGMGYLLERWALLMLFFSTNGEYWERNDGWYTDTDVCEWEAALRICEPRVQGEAAMTYLDLHSFGLVGTIPKELCCMPKLKKLYLYSNRLTGEIPECLYLMGLDVMDLSNNNFDNNSSTGNTDSPITAIATTNSVMNDPSSLP